MKTNNTSRHRSVAQISQQYARQVADAVDQLKERLLSRYEKIAPGRSALIRDALAQAESQAWETPFPHLLFPDLAALRLASVVAGPASK